MPARIPKADSKAAKTVKELYNFECQICGQTLPVMGERYSEAAYIRPLGAKHGGTDSEDNILCLCPNHRVMFENGTFSIGDDMGLIGMRIYKRVRTVPKHKVNRRNLDYHRKHILIDDS